MPFGKKMHVVLLQLPIPRLTYGLRTGNVPLGAACLKQAVLDLDVKVTLVPESLASYLADAALEDWVVAQNPDVLGFSVFCWNVDRARYLAARIKERCGCRILFGGPEVTPDNTRCRDEAVDLYIHGEGEAAFRALLQNPELWSAGNLCMDGADIFEKSLSPYLADLLEPHIEDMMLLETQRGCPFRCGYCFYNKARKKRVFRPIPILMEEIRWAMDRGLSELFLLDPTLDGRRDLSEFLDTLIRVNRGQKLRIQSEIRAEGITRDLAEKFARAGFEGFEIGLQSTNPEALRQMNRPTDLKAFLRGVGYLKDVGILPRIDLIAGLPGDDPDGFLRSVDFVASHGLSDDVQVFPLSILPGTDFRQRAGELGLLFGASPPYTVISTPSFSEEALQHGLYVAGERLDTALYPFPDFDGVYHRGSGKMEDIHVFPGKDALFSQTGGSQGYLAKLFFPGRRKIEEVRDAARRLTQPYQVLIPPDGADMSRLESLVSMLAILHPFTPFDMVFFDPPGSLDTQRLLEAFAVPRPHFLDGDLRFLEEKPGNRSLVFTRVSDVFSDTWEGAMHRRVYWWRKKSLPGRDILEALDDWDAVLLDSRVPQAKMYAWQDAMASFADLLPLLTFSDMALQLRWLGLNAKDTYWPGAFSAL